MAKKEAAVRSTLDVAKNEAAVRSIHSAGRLAAPTSSTFSSTRHSNSNINNVAPVAALNTSTPCNVDVVTQRGYSAAPTSRACLLVVTKDVKSPGTSIEPVSEVAVTAPNVQ